MRVSFRTTDFDRIVIRGNINRRISKKFYVSGNVQFTHSEGNQKPTAGNTTDNMGVVLNSLRYNNVFPAFNPDGSYFNLKGETAEDMSINHPLLFVNEVKNVTKNNAALGSLSVEFRPISDLSIKSTLNARYSNSVRDLYYPRSTQQGTLYPGICRQYVVGGAQLHQRDLRQLHQEIPAAPFAGRHGRFLV